jgi:predicted RNA binding protein YcfA (HicA-like mRNA interferase family)
MVDGYGRQLEQLLRDHGCTFVRHGKGDHEIWRSPITNRNVTLDRSVKVRHTANAILKDAGIKHRF